MIGNIKKFLNGVLVLAMFSILLALPGAAVLVGTASAQAEVLDPTCKDFQGRPAQDIPELCRENETTKNQTTSDNSIYGQNGIINKAVRILVTIIAIASVVMIIIGGIRYVISLGDPTSINGAKNTILYALIGLVVAVIGQLLIVFVLSKL